MKNKPGTILLLLIFLGAAQVDSQDATTVVDSEIRSNFESIAVRVHFEGDANQNNSATMEYRKSGDAVWLPAHPLSAIAGETVGQSGKALAGSIVYLQKNTKYEVRIMVDDPDGVNTSQVDLSIPTRDDNFPTGGGAEWFVSPDGDDANPGTTDAPFKTIQKAANLVSPGDVVKVKAGTYRETVHITRSGSADDYIMFQAQDENVIIDGARDEFQDIDDIDQWTEYTQGVYYATIPWGFDTHYCSVDGIRFYKYDNLSSLMSGESGVQVGYYLDSTGSKRIYIKLPEGDDPDQHHVEIALLDYGFHVDNADYVVIDGFITRNFGKDERRGVGIYMDNCSHVVVQNCTVSNSVYGIHGNLEDDDPNPRSSYLLVQDNIIFQNGLWELPWTVAYRQMGGQGINLEGAEGNNVIRRNHVRGFVDGIVLGDGAGPSFNDDIHDNTVLQSRDDGIELDCDDINVKVWNNVVDGANSGLSHSEAAIGPLYVFRNIITGFAEYSLKNRQDGGPVYHYNNVIVATSPTVSPVIYLAVYRYNQVFKNNIFVGQRTVLQTGASLDAMNCYFDYNLYYTTDQTRFIEINSVRYEDLQEFRNATGQELNGIYGYPEFMNPKIGDFRLTSYSPCIDAGENIPNFCSDYVGNAADIGATEFNGFSDVGPTYIAGKVSGYWIARRSPYIVTDDLILNSGSELVIEPGTEIWFRENCKWEVQPGARIIAEGTVTDTIVFRGAPVNADSNTCWGGVRLLMADDASSFSYCKFTDGYSSPFIFTHDLDNYGGAMLIYGCDVTVSQSTFSGNRASGAGGALAIFDCDPIIRFCEIIDNYSENDAGAIFVQNSQGLIQNSLIARNSCLYDGGALYCDGQANIEVTNTRIVQNYSGDDGGAGLCYDSEPRFVNCTIVDNTTEGHGGAFRNSTSGTVSITNSIVWRNDGSSIIRGGISITYSCVQMGISSSGNNILKNPEFQSTESLDYLLAENSPCIDAGNPAAEYNDPEDPNNPGQALYPALGTLQNDMGAYGGPGAVEQDFPVPIADELNDSNVPEYFDLKPCYPNPFNAWTTIEFALPEDVEVEVSIYNITGQKLKSFDRRYMQAGVHRIQWNASDVSSGVYIIRMATTKFSESRKVMLIK